MQLNAHVNYEIVEPVHLNYIVTYLLSVLNGICACIQILESMK